MNVSHMQAILVCSKGSSKILTSASMRIPLELADQRLKRLKSMNKINDRSTHSHRHVKLPEPKTRQGSENLLVKEHIDSSMTRNPALEKSRQSSKDTKR